MHPSAPLRGQAAVTKNILFLVAIGLVCSRVEAQTDTAPIVATKPQGGRFVELPSGYMVAHAVTIPGTEIQFEMIPVPGSPASGIGPFWIGKYEVTLREYGEYAKLYDLFKELDKDGKAPSANAGRDDVADPVDVVSAPTPVYDPRGRFEGVTSPDCPAYSMTLFAAKQYTKWLSLITSTPYRLPTEAEWMQACCADGGGYFWQDEQLRKFAVFDLETDNVVPVGSRQPNAWGIYDMHGNVSEWVITRCAAATTEEDDSSAVPATWPPVWISKGGNFASPLEDCLPDRRFVVTSDEWDEEANFPRSTTWLGSHSDRVRIGFRIVRQLGDLDKTAMSKFWEAETPHYRELIDFKLLAGPGAEGVVDASLLKKTKDKSWQPLKWINR